MFSMLNGWKTIIGYALLQVPFFSGNQSLLAAVQDLVASPSIGTALPVLAQVVMAVGVGHRVVKNIQDPASK